MTGTWDMHVGWGGIQQGFQPGQNIVYRGWRAHSARSRPAVGGVWQAGEPHLPRHLTRKRRQPHQAQQSAARHSRPWALLPPPLRLTLLPAEPLSHSCEPASLVLVVQLGCCWRRALRWSHDGRDRRPCDLVELGGGWKKKKDGARSASIEVVCTTPTDLSPPRQQRMQTTVGQADQAEGRHKRQIITSWAERGRDSAHAQHGLEPHTAFPFEKDSCAPHLGMAEAASLPPDDAIRESNPSPPRRTDIGDCRRHASTYLLYGAVGGSEHGSRGCGDGNKNMMGSVIHKVQLMGCKGRVRLDCAWPLRVYSGLKQHLADWNVASTIPGLQPAPERGVEGVCSCRSSPSNLFAAPTPSPPAPLAPLSFPPPSPSPHLLSPYMSPPSSPARLAQLPPPRLSGLLLGSSFESFCTPL